MKLFKNLFRPYFVIRELQRENTQLKEEVIELKDTNESLWFMIEEIKTAEQEASAYYSLLSSKSAGEA
jgi:hypothetical protein